MKLNKFKSKVIVRCSRCAKGFDGGYYFQIFNRRDRTDRDNAFLCDVCTKELVEFINEYEDKK